jgi:phosphatidylinositol alpha 1,6-mannosyltransferase
MRILHFAGTILEGHDGVSRVLHRLRQEFARTSDQHHFISPILPQRRFAEALGVPSLPLPVSSGYRLSRMSSRGLEAHFSHLNPDVLHIHSPCTLGWAAALWGRREGIPVVSTFHTHFPSYADYYGVGLLKPLVWWYMDKFYQRSDVVVAPSSSLSKELQSQGFADIVTIPHGVDTARFSPQFRSEAWRQSVGGQGKIVVLLASRLVWEKNLRLFAEAVQSPRFADKILPVVVGDGPARAELQKLLPQAHFTGFLDADELATAFASSDLFVFPSVTETFGNVTVEALASGVPAICARAGGAVDIVQDGVNGYLCEPNSLESVREHMHRLISDHEHRLTLRKNAPLTLSKFQWKHSATAHHALYQSVVTRKRAESSAATMEYLPT